RPRRLGRQFPMHEAALIVAQRLACGEERVVVVALVHEFLGHAREFLAAPVLVGRPTMMPRDVVAAGQDNQCDHADGQPAAQPGSGGGIHGVGLRMAAGSRLHGRGWGWCAAGSDAAWADSIVMISCKVACSVSRASAALTGPVTAMPT